MVDASVTIKLFIDDELSERAYGLFELLTSSHDVEFHVPDLFFIECTNVMLKYVRWGGLDLKTAQRNLADLAALRLKVSATMDLMALSLELAQRLNISAYDACYAALADYQGLPLITADEKLISTLPGSTWLGNFD